MPVAHLQVPVRLYFCNIRDQILAIDLLYDNETHVLTMFRLVQPCVYSPNLVILLQLPEENRYKRRNLLPVLTTHGRAILYPSLSSSALWLPPHITHLIGPVRGREGRRHRRAHERPLPQTLCPLPLAPRDHKLRCLAVEDVRPQHVVPGPRAVVVAQIQAQRRAGVKVPHLGRVDDAMPARGPGAAFEEVVDQAAVAAVVTCGAVLESLRVVAAFDVGGQVELLHDGLGRV